MSFLKQLKQSQRDRQIHQECEASVVWVNGVKWKRHPRYWGLSKLYTAEFPYGRVLLFHYVVTREGKHVLSLDGDWSKTVTGNSWQDVVNQANVVFKQH